MDNDEKDVKKELKETQQEVMIELKLKTDKFLAKFKEQAKRSRLRVDNL